MDEQCHCSCQTSLGFAYGDPNFSDRTLKLIIFEDSPRVKEGTNTESSELADDIMSLKKIRKYNGKLEEGTESRVKTIYINSAILAAKSAFFFKLFIGMRESEQREATLNIHSLEEGSLIDVLKFMYSSKLLTAKSPIPLLKALLTADKFSVPSCVSYCSKKLLSFVSRPELAFLCIDLPSSIVSNYDSVKKLVGLANGMITCVYNDIAKNHKDIMNLSLDGMKSFLSNDNLRLDSEDAVYDLFSEWAEVQFPDPEERRKVYSSELCNLICLERMTPQKLKNVLTAWMDNQTGSDPVITAAIIEAIVFNKSTSLSKSHRSYKLSPVSVTSFESPVRHCIVFWDLTKKECEKTAGLKTRNFVLDGHVFYLSVKPDAKKRPVVFFLYLKKSEKQSVEVEIDFGVRRVEDGHLFERAGRKVRWTFEKGNDGGYNPDCVEICFDHKSKNKGSLAAGAFNFWENYNYYINDVIHLKFDITLVGDHV